MFHPRPARLRGGARLSSSACAPVLALLAVAVLAPGAWAAPEEVQVYRDDVTPLHAWGLEVNQNYVLSGTRADEPSGALGPVHLYRLTPELDYGVARNWELGLLAMTTVRNGEFDAHGAKLHVRYITPRPEGRPWYGGFNLEVGYTDKHLEDRPATAELRGIAGYGGRRWIVAFNPTVETAADTRRVEPVSLELQSKVGYRLDERWILGLESYNEMGPIRRFGPLRDEPQMLYVTADVTLPRGDLDVGVGRGLTGSSDGWAVKVVWGLPLTRGRP